MMKDSVISNVYYVLKNSWKYDKTIVLILVAQSLIGIGIPYISVYLPSVVLEGITGERAIEYILISVFSLVLFLAIFNCISVYCSAICDSHLMNNKIRYLSALYRKNMELDYDYVESKEGRNQLQYVMFSLLNENNSITGMLNHLGVLWGYVGSIFLYAGIIGNLNGLVLMILLILSIGHFVIEKKILEKQFEYKDEWIDIDRKIECVNNYLRDEIANKDIKMFSMKSWILSKLDQLINQRIEWIKRLAQYDLKIAFCDVAMLVVRDSIAYLYVINGLLNGNLLISQFTYYFGVITGLSIFITNLTSEIAFISQKSKEVSEYRRYLSKETRSTLSSVTETPDINSVAIEFRNVYFNFEAENEYILKNINFKVMFGEKVALVGENGAGKTTLIKLLCGLYRPTKGKILLNGIDIRDFSQEELSNIFAMIFQEIFILPMSVAENVAFGEFLKEEEKIKQSLKMSGLETVLGDLKQPMTKLLHSDGVVLSGGQEQRLVLARALYKILCKNSPILVLDEPTAALDPIAEKQLYEKYNELTKGKSSIFVSHRLASTRFCDTILVMKEGEIVEMGTHQQLMDLDGYYKELFDIQSQPYRES